MVCGCVVHTSVPSAAPPPPPAPRWLPASVPALRPQSWAQDRTPGLAAPRVSRGAVQITVRSRHLPSASRATRRRRQIWWRWSPGRCRPRGSTWMRKSLRSLPCFTPSITSAARALLHNVARPLHFVLWLLLRCCGSMARPCPSILLCCTSIPLVMLLLHFWKTSITLCYPLPLDHPSVALHCICNAFCCITPHYIRGTLCHHTCVTQGHTSVNVVHLFSNFVISVHVCCTLLRGHEVVGFTRSVHPLCNT